MPNSFLNPASTNNNKPPTLPLHTPQDSSPNFTPGFTFVTAETISHHADLIEAYERIVEEQYPTIVDLPERDPLNIRRNSNSNWQALIATVRTPEEKVVVGGMLLDYPPFEHSYMAQALNLFTNGWDTEEAIELYGYQWRNHEDPQVVKELGAFERLLSSSLTKQLTPEKIAEFRNMQVCEGARFARIKKIDNYPPGFGSAVLKAFALAAHQIPRKMQQRSIPSEAFIYLSSPKMAAAEHRMLTSEGNRFNTYVFPVLLEDINFDRIKPVHPTYYYSPRVSVWMFPQKNLTPNLQKT